MSRRGGGGRGPAGAAGSSLSGGTDNRLVRCDGTTAIQSSSVMCDDTGLVGLATDVPTHSLTLSSTATGVAVYGTSDQVTNYERVLMSVVAGIPTIAFEKGGSGTARYMQLTTNAGASGLRIDSSGGGLTILGSASSQCSIVPQSNAVGMLLQGKITTGTVAGLEVGAGNSYTASSGTQTHAKFSCTANQTSTAAFDCVLIDPTLTAVGSGGGTLLHAKAGGVSRFKIGTNGQANVASGTATPAGGSTTANLVFGTTAGFGIYYGSGAPSVTAGQGSLYMRSDGSTTITRLYVNTDGGTTWTAMTSVA